MISADAKMHSELSMAKITKPMHLSQADNFLVRQFRTTASLSTGCPALRLAIFHVIQMGAEKKMFWVGTLTIVTGMTDAHSVGYGAFKNLI